MIHKIDHSSSVTPEERRTVRPWPVRVIVLLLVLEGAGLCGLGLSTGGLFNWNPSFAPEGLPQQGIVALFIAGVFTPVGGVALLAALGMLLRIRVSWLLAMLVQAVTLLVCLQLYFTERPGFIYPVMLCSIAAVLYLNSSEVRMAFQAEPPSPSVEGLDES